MGVGMCGFYIAWLCVCVGFEMSECVYICVGFVMCGFVFLCGFCNL